MKNRPVFKDITNLTQNLSAPNYLIDELIELDAIGGLIGPSSVGKSFVAISMAAAVASGTDFAGKAVQQGKVLYLAGEGLNGISRRFAGWMQHTGAQIPKGYLHVSQTTIAMDEAGASALLTEVENIPDINLVIIDTLARHMVGDENSNSDMNAFISAVDSIRDQHGCAVFIVHHTGHSSDKSNRARGASSFYAALDFEYLLKGNKKGNGTVEGTKNKEDVLYPKRAFSLVPVELNGLFQANGKPVTTAVVEWGDFVEQGANSSTEVESTPAYKSLKGALEAQDNYKQITSEGWREHVYKHSNRSTSGSKRTEFNSFKKKLLEGGVIESDGDDFKVITSALTKLSAAKELSDQGLESDAVH
jgi:hypothetical protein